MKFGTEYVDTSSYSLYIIALSVLFQCFLFIGGSALADHGGNYKLLIKQHIIYFIKSYNNDFFFYISEPKEISSVLFIYWSHCYRSFLSVTKSWGSKWYAQLLVNR